MVASGNYTVSTFNSDIFTINPAIPGNGAVIHTLGNLGFVPVNLNAQSTYFGLYATDTFDITSQLSLTAGGRLNVKLLGGAQEMAAA